MARTLVVEDNLSLRNAVVYNLKKEGYEVVVAEDGEQALAVWEKGGVDLVLLDVMLPTLDGFEVCRRLRQLTSVPILMMTARSDEVDRVVGLELGADDYVTKPFSMRELLARVKAILRRQALLQDEWRQAKTKTSTEAVVAGPLQIDLPRRQVLYEGRDVRLTPKEFDLLVQLARHPNQIFSADQLSSLVWGYSSLGDVRTVRVHIRLLREKLEPNPSRPRLIETLRGVGYRLSV
jgi:DNA-binding response OmpR family regulator